jgi:hypothetical protein
MQQKFFRVHNAAAASIILHLPKDGIGQHTQIRENSSINHELITLLGATPYFCIIHIQYKIKSSLIYKRTRTQNALQSNFTLSKKNLIIVCFNMPIASS